MKNIIIILLSTTLILSCAQTQNENFNLDIVCIPDKIPDFDGIKVAILNENGKPVKDTIIERIKKKRDVFKPCRQLTYRAILRDSFGNDLSNSRIRITPTGKRWMYDSDMQDEVIIEYEYSTEDFKNSKTYTLNKGLKNHLWQGLTKEGIIENVDQVWMHPFRANQFNFTEVAPFPEVKFPLQIGKTWSGILNIQNGWGDWENSNGSFDYEIISKVSIETKAGLIPNCWKVKSQSSYEFGKSELVFWFNEQLGFVKKEYRNYGGQTLSITLEEINENSK